MTQDIDATARPTPLPIHMAVLLGLIAVADLMIWDRMPGVGLVVLFALLAATATVFFGPARPVGWVILCLGLLPMVETVQVSSLLLGWGGLTVFCAMLVSGSNAPWVAAFRIPGWAFAQSLRDLIAAPAHAPALRARASTGLTEWIVPVGLGVVFVGLFAAANPIIDSWLAAMLDWNGPTLPHGGRIMLWLMAACLFWPVLRLAAGAPRLRSPIQLRALGRVRMLSAGSVFKSLLTFNVIFAVQTLSDLAILSGGVALPDGMTYAEYAHRGAYPLLATALLAGGFAILSQPFLADRPALKWLLVAWVAQNVLLVASSLLRLDLYVEVYGLTRWRVASFVWMGLVATGLALMIVQVARARPVIWLMSRSAALAVLAIYVCSFINIDGMIARHNLAKGGAALDEWYLCNLSGGALPAIRSYEQSKGVRFCYSRQPHVYTPRDAREWGFRNARLRNSLAAIEGAAQ